MTNRKQATDAELRELNETELHYITVCQKEEENMRKIGALDSASNYARHAWTWQSNNRRTRREMTARNIR